MGGVVLGDYTYDTAAEGTTFSNMQWREVTKTFVWNGAGGSDLQFISIASSDPRTGAALDDVSVNAVPLPASVGVGFVMLAGFGALFGISKRIKRKARIA